MEQHPVPQNITTFQFRLIGDMTVKQFVYLAVGTVTAYACYKLLPLPVIFTVPLALGIFLLGFGLAFVPINGRPMDIWILSFIKSVYGPTFYVWQKQKTPPAGDGQKNVDLTKTFPLKASHTPDAKKPAPEDKGVSGTPLPVPEKQPTAKAPAVTWQEKAHEPTAVIKKEQKTETPKQKSANPFAALARLFRHDAKPPASTIPEKKDKQKSAPPVKPVAVIQSTREYYPKPLIDVIKNFISRLFPKATAGAPPATAPAHKPASSPASSKSADSAGIFSDLKSPSVIGRVQRGDTKEKAEQKEKKERAKQLETQRQIEEEKRRTTELEGKLKQLQGQLQEKSLSEARITELQKQLSETLAGKKHLQSELELLKKQKQKPAPSSSLPSRKAGVLREKVKKPTVRIISPEAAVGAGLPRLTTFPNVVTGIIKDSQDSLLPGVLVTVRDKEGIPLRALKTNKLGQFAASTPLSDGTYFIEVEDPRNRFLFDRAQISISGKVVPAVEIVAKSQKEISRESLEKEIFGNQNT